MDCFIICLRRKTSQVSKIIAGFYNTIRKNKEIAGIVAATSSSNSVQPERKT